MNAPLWTAHELLEATGGVMSAPFDAGGVSIDTRTLAAGDLFVALIGEGRDGHGFVADALAKGAAGAMVHDDASRAGPVLRVDGTLQALITSDSTHSPTSIALQINSGGSVTNLINNGTVAATISGATGQATANHTP